MFVCLFTNNMKFEIPTNKLPTYLQINKFGDGVCPHNFDISWKYTWEQLTIFIECWNLNKMHNYKYRRSNTKTCFGRSTKGGSRRGRSPFVQLSASIQKQSDTFSMSKVSCRRAVKNIAKNW